MTQNAAVVQIDRLCVPWAMLHVKECKVMVYSLPRVLQVFELHTAVSGIDFNTLSSIYEEHL